MARNRIAGSSRKTYHTGFTMFARFKVVHRPGAPLLPASDQEVAEWFAASPHLTAATLRNYYYGLAAAHVDNGLPCPALCNRLLPFSVLRGVKRDRRDVVKRVQAISVADLRKVALVIRARLGAGGWVSAATKLNDLACFAAMLVGFYAMLRKSNLTGPKALRRADITPERTPGGVVVWAALHHTKTIQHGERVHRVPVRQVHGTGGRASDDLCPVRALADHVQLTSTAPRGACLFQWVTPAGRLVDMTHVAFVQRMRELLQAAGLNPGAFTGHSLRRGGATMAFELKCDVRFIALHGDWTSDVVYQYHQVSDRSRCEIASIMASAARSA